MAIFNVRNGFATNSSSTHSVVDISDPKDRDGLHTDGFGWGIGYCTDPKTKLAYLAAQFLGITDNTWIHNIIHNLEEKYLPREDHPLITPEWIEENYSEVDHQSYMMKVYEKGNYGDSINIDFYKDLFEYVMAHDNICFYIGNDNDNCSSNFEVIEELHSIFYGHELNAYSTNGKIFGRKDNDYWTLFNSESGKKIRFSFDDSASRPTKATYPELVDFKLTDRCNSNCKFCYQGSTPNGEHADIKYVLDALKVLKEMEVFEVVFGGGDPFEYPFLNETIIAATDLSLCAAISTRKYDKIIEEFGNIVSYKPSIALAKLSAIGVSVSSVADMEKIDDAFKEAFKVVRGKLDLGIAIASLGKTREALFSFHNKTKYHIVMGTVTRDEFTAMMKHCYKYNRGMLLLGYKTTGRGCEVEPMDYSWWLDVIKETGVCKVGIDTCMAKTFGDLLAKSNIDPRTYEIHEGKFSCYIDGTKQTLSRDSYSVKPDEVFKLEFVKRNWKDKENVNVKNFAEIFKKF